MYFNLNQLWLLAATTSMLDVTLGAPLPQEAGSHGAMLSMRDVSLSNPVPETAPVQPAAQETASLAQSDVRAKESPEPEVTLSREELETDPQQLFDTIEDGQEGDPLQWLAGGEPLKHPTKRAITSTGAHTEPVPPPSARKSTAEESQPKSPTAKEAEGTPVSKEAGDDAVRLGAQAGAEPAAAPGKAMDDGEMFGAILPLLVNVDSSKKNRIANSYAAMGSTPDMTLQKQKEFLDYLKTAHAAKNPNGRK